MMQLNSNSLNPLYVQLKKMIQEDINTGKYQFGQQLHTETELCEMYGVSRITTRRAISDLVDEGVLYRQQGKGTFVTKHKIKNELISIGGFTEYSEETGKHHKSRVLATIIVKADYKQSLSLRIAEGDPVLRIDRLLYVGEDPLMIETSYYSSARYPNFEAYLSESVSTYSVLKERYRTEPVTNEKSINVITAKKEESALLKLDVGASLFEIFKIAYDANGEPIHTSLLLMPTSHVTLTVHNGQPKK
jgi:GntR family frlABCD operon transcriptional regulator